MDDRVLKFLTPDCGRDSCRMCKLSNHIPLSCEEYQGNSRKKVEEELTMSWVRQCWNCKVNIEKVSGCNTMTCPLCGKKTCYGCRKPIDNQHTHTNACYNRFSYRPDRMHEEELKKTEEKLKEELEEEEKEMLKNLFNPGPGPSN